MPEVLPSPPMAYLPALPEPRAIATAKHAQVVDTPSPLARSRHQMMSRHLAELFAPGLATVRDDDRRRLRHRHGGVALAVKWPELLRR